MYEVDMDITRIMAYELNNQRVALWKTDEGDYVVSNTVTGKALLCVCYSQASDTFDRCIDTLRDNPIRN